MPQTVSERNHMQSTAETIGLELKEALQLRRIDSLSIHDRNGDLIWLSEQTLGPDEHNVVMEAITVFEVEGNRSYVSENLGDGRSAAFLASATPHGELVAVVMAIADSRTIDTLGTAKLITPKVRSLMQRLAILMKPPTAANKGKPAAQAATGTDSAAAVRKPPAVRDIEGSTISELAALSELELASSALGAAELPLREAPPAAEPMEFATRPRTTIRPAVVARAPQQAASARPVAVATPPAAVTTSPAAATAAIAAAAAKPSAAVPKPAAAPVSESTADAILRNDSQAVSAATQPQPAAAPRTPAQAGTLDIALHVQQLMKLRSGGRTRRYEVLVRGRGDADNAGMSEQLTKALALRESAAAIDRAVTSELVSWLKQNPAIWNSDPASFSINLSLGSLLDVNFTGFVSQVLQSSGVAPDTIGFEVPEKAFLKHREACVGFLEACEKIGCYVVIDDFSMHSDVVPFLASRALRVVKVDPQLTQSAMRDRLSQAMVIAISQASKVLGLHCVAKRIDSVATRQWLAAVGIDFAQGFAIENPRPLAALAEAKAAKDR